MKVITEAILRLELRDSEPEVYYIPEGKILSPAAREYLQMRKIAISKDKPPVIAEEEPQNDSGEAAAKPQLPPAAKYIDEATGAFFTEKPEHMTHLFGNVLVNKNDARIMFRGKLDSLQAAIIVAQATIHAEEGSIKLIDDLGDILGVLREMMRCDVLGEPFKNERIIGLNHAELRERSHNPMKFFNIQQMLLPDYTMGKHYAMLNQLRAQVRETEVAANTAFLDGRKCTRPDIVEELNRMSSAMHIMMCMYLGGVYK